MPLLWLHLKMKHVSRTSRLCLCRVQFCMLHAIFWLYLLSPQQLTSLLHRLLACYNEFVHQGWVRQARLQQTKAGGFWGYRTLQCPSKVNCAPGTSLFLRWYSYPRPGYQCTVYVCHSSAISWSPFTECNSASLRAVRASDLWENSDTWHNAHHL